MVKGCREHRFDFCKKEWDYSVPFLCADHWVEYYAYPDTLELVPYRDKCPEGYACQGWKIL